MASEAGSPTSNLDSQRLGVAPPLSTRRGSTTPSVTAASPSSPSPVQHQQHNQPQYLLRAAAAASRLSALPSTAADINDYSFADDLYTAFLGPYTKQFVETLAYLPVNPSVAFIAARIADQSEHPDSCIGSDKLIDADAYTDVRRALAAALGLTIDDGEYDTAHIALVDLFLEAMALAASRGWTTIQLQRFLMLVRQTHSDVTWITPEASADFGDEDMQLKNVVGGNLSKRLAKLCAKQHTPGLEKFVVEETIVEETVDPAAVAALEAKQRDAKGKAKVALADAVAALPKIKVTNTIRREEVVPTADIVIDVIFSPADAVEIVTFLSATLLQHWRLYRHVATVPRSVATKAYHVFVEDLPKELDRLTDAVPLLQFTQTNERRALWDALEAVVSADFEVMFVAEVNTLHSRFLVEDEAARAEDAQRRAADEAASMTAEEFKRSIAVLKHRLLSSSPSAASAAGSNAANGDDLAVLEERVKKLEAAVHRNETQPAAAAAAAKPGKK